MKKVTNYLLMFFMSASVLFVTSCGEDAEDILNPNAASISIEEADGVEFPDTTVAPGAVITLYLAIDLGDATSADVSVVDDISNAPVFESTLSANPATSTQFSYTVPDDATGTITLTANLTDDTNASLDSDEITITVDPGVAAEIYEAFLLASPTGDLNSDTFFSAETGNLYSFGDVVGTSADLSSTIDFGYAYGATENATINSPSSYPTYIGYDMSRWGTLNETAFRASTLSVADFDAITVDQGNLISDEFDIGSDESNRVIGLAVDDIIAFQTADERYGLIKVVEIVGTDGSTDGIRIEVKVTGNDEEDNG